MAAITREQIETRIEQLQADKAQMAANLHAINGAIQDCEFWLEQAERVDEPSPTDRSD